MVVDGLPVSAKLCLQRGRNLGFKVERTLIVNIVSKKKSCRPIYCSEKVLKRFLERKYGEYPTLNELSQPPCLDQKHVLSVACPFVFL